MGSSLSYQPYDSAGLSHLNLIIQRVRYYITMWKDALHGPGLILNFDS